MTERDEKFINTAQALWDRMVDEGYTWENYDPDKNIYRASVIDLIAQFLYDFAESGCMAISDQQLKQGVRLHPHAKHRIIAEMTTSQQTEKNTQESP